MNIEPKFICTVTFHDRPMRAASLVSLIRARAPRPDLWGENSVMSKLTTEKVAEIKRRLSLGHSQQSIANDFQVHQTLISAIKRGVAW